MSTACLPLIPSFQLSVVLRLHCSPNHPPTQEKQILSQGTSFSKSPSLTCSISLDLTDPLFSCLGISGPASGGVGVPGCGDHDESYNSLSGRWTGDISP